jgi:very-short-patch-repair endonuclease
MNNMNPKRTTPEKMRRAAELRKSPTPAEARLWAHIRNNQLNGVSFRRQHAIGPYITDFCSPRSKLIVELDGSQHLDQEEYDNDRTRYFNERGYKVLRFWNNEVINDLNGVIQAIMNELEDMKQ